MGAKFTICCCHYLKHNQEERNAILRLEKLCYDPNSSPFIPLLILIYQSTHL